MNSPIALAQRHQADAALALCRPSVNELVLGLFADALPATEKAVWLGELIALLAPLGVSERALRTGVFRLVQQGALLAHRSGRRSAYSTNPESNALLAPAPPMMRRYQPRWPGNWTLVTGWNAARTPEQSLRVRAYLLANGYQQLRSGVYGRPGGDPAAVEAALIAQGDPGALLVCDVARLHGIGQGALRTLVRQSWELDKVAAAYERFIEQFQHVLAAMSESRWRHEVQWAFAAHTLLLHGWRQVVCADPQLPVQLLPADWPAERARALANRLQHLVGPDADTFVDTIRPRAPQALAA
ncbi:MAG: PaaX family transcriptional regulator C-terminal domain-containing protein [Pseudomonadota bacterium]